MANKKYISLARLSDFLDNIKAKFSQIGHKHTISDLTDYKVDTSLSPDSNNPVANSVLDAEFYAISEAMGALELAIDGKASSSHDHNNLYYTEEEIDTKLSSINEHVADTNIHVTATNKSNWNSAYTHSTSAHARTDATKVEDSTTNGNIKINGTETNVYSHPSSGVAAGTYRSVSVDSQGHVVGGSNPTTLEGYGITNAETKGAVSSHNTSDSAHNDIRLLIENLTNRLNTLANSDDTTLDQMSEVVAYIKNNKHLIDNITTKKVNVSDIVNNLTTNTTDKPLSAAQGVAIQLLIDSLQQELDTHTHAISDVSGLQDALDGKAASSHGTHVSYSTTAPVMDGTASVGSASTVARSDHKHPTDTSRASKTEFDTHTGNTTVHITATERTNWNNAKTTAESAQIRADNAYALAENKVGSLSDLGITATATELNYMDGVTSNVQTQLDGKANTVHIHPYGVCYSGDFTNAKTVTVDNFSLVEGARVIVKFNLANNASSPTLNVNGTGAKPIMKYGDTAAGTAEHTNGWEAGAIVPFTYDGTNWVQDYWYNTTYTNASLGHGLGYCSTYSGTEMTVELYNYEKSEGGVVSVEFIYNVPASATLNINNKGASEIYYKGATIPKNLIQGGDTATFIYYGMRYHLLSIDRWHDDIVSLKSDISKKSDWNQNNSYEADYIKNRTHYTEPQLRTVLAQRTVSNGNSLSGLESTTPSNTYIVTIDGTKYQCSMWVNTYGEKCYGDSRITTVYDDNTGTEITDMTNPEDTPFYINACADEGEDPSTGLPILVWNWYILFNSSFKYTSHVIKIETPTGVTIYHTLDERFIPDSVARTNAVNALSNDLYETQTQMDAKVNIATMTTAEYNALESRNANTLYMLTDAEEQPTQVQIITWGADD